MPLSDKTRKILWAQSGNRCAVCRQKLVVDKTPLDTASVIGEECHIAARSEGGPRFDPDYPANKLDDLENLILLCGVHHKVVDDQPETHTVAWLRSKKSEHEDWIESKLTDSNELAPMRVIRSKKNLPQRLDRVLTGKALLGLAEQCHGRYTDHDENLDEEETEVVATFLEDVSDYSEMASDVGPGEHVRICKSLDDRLKELAKHGFYAFAGVENARIEGGKIQPAEWKFLHLTVTRATNPNVIFPDEPTPGNEKP